MGSADPPRKMHEKVKSENMQKDQFSEWGWGEGRVRERRYADHIFIQIQAYFRMHHFVAKFSTFSSLRVAREH